MKIVLIHGQNHKGSSYHIGRMLAEKVVAPSNETMAQSNRNVSQVQQTELVEFFLPRDLNHFCMGCYQCIEGDEQCPFYAEKYRIMKEVEAADVLIFTTPTYCLHVSAPMKAFMDLTFSYWMVHRPRKEMFCKKAAVISTAAGSGAKSATKDVANTLFYWGVPYVKQYGIAVQAMDWEHVTEAKKKKIEKATDKLAQKLLHNKVKVGIKTRFIFSMMGMMQKKGMGSSPTEKDYWEQNGWLGAGRPWK